MNLLQGRTNVPKEETPPVVKTFFPCLDLEAFCRMCSRLYQDDQEGTIFERLKAYSGLSVLCSDFSAVINGSQSEHHHQLSRAFSQHMLKTVDVLPAVITPSWEGIEAVLTAVSSQAVNKHYTASMLIRCLQSFACLELCKPQLGLTLTSIAAKFCQALGYNRLSLQDGGNDTARQRKILLFWQVYIYDRNTALRLGRPPSIPEYDVSTDFLETERFPEYEPAVIHLHQYWAYVADVQGAISQKLYSPVGSRQSLGQRGRLVKALATKLQSAWARRLAVNEQVEALHSGFDPHGFTVQCIRVGDEIAFYSTLTLLLHALSPPGKPTADAVEAARASLRAYKTVSNVEMHNVYTWSGFCHW